MFNKTYHTDNSVNFPDEVRIVHERPTTTKQIKLLREMEKELRNDILSHIRIDNNEFKFNCFINRTCDFQLELIAKFKLNQKECTVAHQFDTFSPRKQAVKDFFQKIADQITFELLHSNQEVVENVLKELRLDSY